MVKKIAEHLQVSRRMENGVIVPVWKRKRDVKYRGVTLLSDMLDMLERILDGRIRTDVEGNIGEEQHGFTTRRGITDGMFAFRQLVETKRTSKDNGQSGRICSVDIDVSRFGHDELEIHIEGTKLKQICSFENLGGAICGDSNSDTELRRRSKAGANARWKVEDVM